MSDLEPTAPEGGLRRRPARARARRRRVIAAGAAAAVLVLGGAGTAWAITANRTHDNTAQAAPPKATEPAATTPSATSDPAPSTEPAPEPAATPAPQWDIDSPASLQVVVNKQRPLNPISWQPDDLAYPEIPNSSGQPLRLIAAEALEAMYAEASAAGVPFAIVSGFRSYDYQAGLFQSYAAASGVAEAETFSARPGHSEHQTGLAVDISECLGCALSEEFGVTAAGVWARDNAHRFGFILRYQQGEQPVVGYVYEPWHFRYVGVEIASDVHERGIRNLEDYFGLPAAPNY